MVLPEGTKKKPTGNEIRIGSSSKWADTREQIPATMRAIGERNLHTPLDFREQTKYEKQKYIKC
jgi:hypothetical protein